MKLWLVRHAAVEVAAGVCYGRSDVAARADATAEAVRKLAPHLPSGLTMWCSPLARCTALARGLVESRADLTWSADPRLAEMDFGAWEGRHWDDIGAAGMAAWMADFAQHRPGGGESVASFVARVSNAFEEACASGRDMVWITHAGVVRAARLLHSGSGVPASAAGWPREGLPPGEWTVLDLPPRG